MTWFSSRARDLRNDWPDVGERATRTLGRLPDFLIIGAMKSATTTLHVQLARQPGLFMSHPKEPNFFSDDDQFARGIGWYSALFEQAGENALCGESSTHYTKLPTYPHTVDRIAATFPRVRLIYVMRHPVDRLMSQYVHEMTTGSITAGILEAIKTHPELIDYGRYSMQLQPYLEALGAESVLPLFFDRLVQHPQEELERICRFIGYPGTPRWDPTIKPQNVGSERLRRSMVREILVRAPLLTKFRRSVVPRSWSESIKGLWRAQIDPPDASPALVDHLRGVYDDDLGRLGRWLGIRFSCDNFTDVALAGPHEWDEHASHHSSSR